MHHPINRHVFYDTDAEAVNDGTAILMGEVLTPKPDTLMDTCHDLTSLHPFTCSLFGFGQAAFCLCQYLFFLAKKTWGANFFSRRQESEGFQSNVWIRFCNFALVHKVQINHRTHIVCAYAVEPIHNDNTPRSVFVNPSTNSRSDLLALLFQ